MSSRTGDREETTRREENTEDMGRLMEAREQMEKGRLGELRVKRGKAEARKKMGKLGEAREEKEGDRLSGPCQ